MPCVCIAKRQDHMQMIAQCILSIQQFWSLMKKGFASRHVFKLNHENPATTEWSHTHIIPFREKWHTNSRNSKVLKGQSSTCTGWITPSMLRPCIFDTRVWAWDWNTPWERRENGTIGSSISVPWLQLDRRWERSGQGDTRDASPKRSALTWSKAWPSILYENVVSHVNKLGSE